MFRYPLRKWAVAIVVGMVTVPPASAANLHTTFPFVGTFVSPCCNGEEVNVSGNIHLTIDPDGVPSVSSFDFQTDCK